MTRCTSYNTLIIIGFDERIAFYVVAVVVFVLLLFLQMQYVITRVVLLFCRYYDTNMNDMCITGRHRCIMLPHRPTCGMSRR